MHASPSTSHLATKMVSGKIVVDFEIGYHLHVPTCILFSRSVVLRDRQRQHHSLYIQGEVSLVKTVTLYHLDWLTPTPTPTAIPMAANTTKMITITRTIIQIFHRASQADSEA